MSSVCVGVIDIDPYSVCVGALVPGVAPSNSMSMKWSLATNGIESRLSARRYSIVHSFGVPAFMLYVIIPRLPKLSAALSWREICLIVAFSAFSNVSRNGCVALARDGIAFKLVLACATNGCDLAITCGLFVYGPCP